MFSNKQSDNLICKLNIAQITSVNLNVVVIINFRLARHTNVSLMIPLEIQFVTSCFANFV